MTGTFVARAQERYFTRTGYIAFFSETPMENIEAHNYKVTSVWDASTGAVEFAALIKAFEFEKALMQGALQRELHGEQHLPEGHLQGNVLRRYGPTS